MPTADTRTTKTKAAWDPITTTAADIPPTCTQTEYAPTPPLHPVQQALNDKGYDCGTPDGISGEKTRTALIQFQEDNNLTADGLIGEEVKTALGI